MHRPGIPLAPTSKRLIAFGIDLGMIGGLLGISYCVPGFPEYGSLAFLVAFWGLYTAYHVVTVFNPDVGMGRLLQGISVVSSASGQAPNLRQAVARAVVRSVWALCGVSAAKATDSDALFLLPVLAELALIKAHPWRQTLADLIAGTVVIATPPLQPHRAPAAPMYSREDAEFGPPPKHDA